MSRHFFAKLAIAVLFGFGSCLPSLASALLESAKQDFQAKRYHASADTLNKVVQAEPANPEGYYWLGRALEELKDRDGAKTMYMSAFKLNPFGPQAPVAKKALMDLATKQAALDHPTDGPEVMAQTLQLIERQTSTLKTIKINDGNRTAQWRIDSGNRQAYQMGYQANMQMPNVPNYGGAYPPNYGGANAPIQSVKDIRAQMRAAGTAGNPYLNVGNPYTNRTYDNWAGYPANNQVSANRGNATYFGNGAPTGGGYAPQYGNAGGYGGGGGYPAAGGYGYGGATGYGATTATGYGIGGGYQYTPLNMYGRTPVSNLGQINTSYIRADSSVQALHAQREGVNSAAELQKSANNLGNLLGEKPRAGSPHLRALGTNLFVRNYSEHDDDSTPPVDPLLELKARQEKLSDMDKGDKAKALKLTP